DPLEDLDHAPRMNLQACFFENLATHAFLQPLAGFEHAAGKRPVSFERRPAALNQQHAIAIENDRAHPQNGPSRVTAIIALFTGLNRSRGSGTAIIALFAGLNRSWGSGTAIIALFAGLNR